MSGQRDTIFEIAKNMKIDLDEGQKFISENLDKLAIDLEQKSKKFSFPFFNKSSDFKGLYIYGGVGRGKSMIMDIFFENIRLENKRRMHFHDFMKEVHSKIYSIGQKNKNIDPVQVFAKKFIEKTKLLCFDEMEIRDIADAMIIYRLFKSLFSLGLTLVTTSNQPPENLYKNGLHRDRFLPFIDLINFNMKVSQIKEGKDWRKSLLIGKKTWLSPINSSNKNVAQKIFNQLTKGFNLKEEEIIVSGRKIRIPNSAGGIAAFDFKDLCEKPLAASDYVELADKFKGFLINNIPSLGKNQNNESRRFIWLIDALYDRKCFLIATSEVDIKKLYTGTEWKFEFSRTISRLLEMSQVVEN